MAPRWVQMEAGRGFLVPHDYTEMGTLGYDGNFMTYQILLEKLLDIEKAIGKESNLAIKNKIIDAENILLDLQKENVEHLRINTNQSFSRSSVQDGYRAEPKSFTLFTSERRERPFPEQLNPRSPLPSLGTNRKTNST